MWRGLGGSGTIEGGTLSFLPSFAAEWIFVAWWGVPVCCGLLYKGVVSLGVGGCEEEFLWVVHDEAQTDKIGEEHACTVRWLSVRFQLLLVQLPTLLFRCHSFVCDFCYCWFPPGLGPFSLAYI